MLCVIRLKESGLEEGNPFLQMGQGCERDNQQTGIKRREFSQDRGLVQLHQMFCSEDSGQMSQENQGYRLRILSQFNELGSTVGGGQLKIWGYFTNFRNAQFNFWLVLAQFGYL